MTAVNHINALLARAQRRINCFAVAFIAPTRQVNEFYCADSNADAELKHIVARAGESFLELSREQHQPILRNRVREVANGPLLGRFVVVPVHDDEGFIGVFIAYNPAIGQEFTAVDARLAQRIGKLFGKAVALSRDPLTGLMTRAAFERQVDSWRKANSHSAAALLYGDIDRLHVINDLFGFKIGDRAIAVAGKRLQNVVAAQNILLCRLSGDRFTVFIPDCTLTRAKDIAEAARDAVATARFSSNAQPIQMSMCWGVALLPPDETSLDHGLAAAEVACKAAKDRGRNRVEVYQDTDASIIRRHDDILIVGQLRSALEEGRFRIFAQPIASLLRNEEVARYEMLVRIFDEDDKLVEPNQFMSAATRYQLLPLLDRCVIGAVLSKLQHAFAQPGFRPIKVALNISGPSIGEPDFIDWLVEALDRSGVPGKLVGFELTETAAVGNVERAQSLMARLGEKGCEFALDDFGTGLSSLSYFQLLNPDAIKIDGSFIRNLLDSKRSESLVRAIAQLANSMGIATVAEYVESPAICMRLIELGVQFGQGYALGKPVPLDKLLTSPASLALAS